MKGQIRLTAVLLTAILSFAMFALVGCPSRQMPGPQPGPGPSPDEPDVDPTVYEQAEELRFLVDIDGGINRILEVQNAATGGDESELEDMRDEVAEVFQQGNISAEANATTVRAHGEYSLDLSPLAGEMGEELAMFSPVEFLSGVGTARVELQSHLSADRWVGHLFIANPGTLVQNGLEFTLGMAGGHDAGPDTFPVIDPEEALTFMLGVDEIREVYDWMGDELLLTLLVNPDFDPDAIPDMRDIRPDEFFGNLPVYPLLAISTDRPGEALDLIQGVADNLFRMNGMAIELERTELDGFDALLLPVDDLAEQMGFYDEEERDEFISVMEEAGPSVAVAVEGYLLVGAVPALEAAVDAFEMQPAGIGRTATLELAWNWDYLIDVYTTSRDAYFGELMEEREFEAVRDILVMFDEEVMGLDELGLASVSIIVSDGENIDMDVETSRESIRLLGLLHEIIEQGMLGMPDMTRPDTRPPRETADHDVEDEDDEGKPGDD